MMEPTSQWTPSHSLTFNKALCAIAHCSHLSKSNHLTTQE